jgi:hypothetical protein
VSPLAGWWLVAAAVAIVGDPLVLELTRLEGFEVELAAEGRGYRIVDVAGEGSPRVGTIERRGAELYLIEDGGAGLALEGPLAVPRIAGPGYKVWVIGEIEGGRLRARRLGVLSPPGRR